MDRIIRLFKTRSFAILLFHVGVLLFNWPLLSMPSEAGGAGLFKYLLIAWTLIVTILVVVGHSIRHAENANKEE